MSNLDMHPVELLCENADAEGNAPVPPVEILVPRSVPLGGPRAMTVRRTLPQRQRSLIGAWCFLDHYGPDDVSATGGMQVPPHPHTGLATVSWLFSGEIEHRDSAGNHAMVVPGELNLMTAGRGISHSEVSTRRTTALHGAQLWFALPDSARFCDPGFDHYAPDPVRGEGFEARVFLGSLAGSVSPVRTAVGLLGAELVLQPGSNATLEVDPGFELGVLADTGRVLFNGTIVQPGELAYQAPGAGVVVLSAPEQEVRLLLLGGEPLGESIVMWWNFIGRSHDEIARFRADWQTYIHAPDGNAAGQDRFNDIGNNTLDALPAPAMPSVRIRPRG